MGYAVFFLVCILIKTKISAYNYLGTAKSLRQDIAELTNGTLKFSDDNIPFYKEELFDTTPEDQTEYDFIVIGAGSAGSTIASRLSEINDVTVLLIEAGSKEYPIMDIPALAVNLQFSDEINWRYQAESSDKFCHVFKDSKCAWTRGKVMGGSSVMNYMMATRGNKNDFNKWANITGDESWSYKKMLKYFKKLENFQVKDVEVDAAFRGTRGPLYITKADYNTELAQAFVEAGKELGFIQNDYNGEKQMGVSYMQSTIKNGERWSTNRAYLYPARNRKNLVLSRNSYVNKIMINEETKSAYGVQFSKFNKDIEVKAKKEIILCAGAINSPKILMLSGIGPAEHLRDLGIDIVKDAPVGENLMDHISYAGLIFKVNDTATFDASSLLDPKNPEIKKYLDKRKGSLAKPSYEALLYVNVDDPNRLNEDPNIELIFGANSGIKNPVIAQAVGVADIYRNKILTDQFNHSAWSVVPMLMLPKSRGKLLLRDKNPETKPKIYPNYLDHPDDVKALIKGIRMSIELSKTEVLKKYGSDLYDIPLPCDNETFNSDAYWKCAIRIYSITTYHHAGTCKMGREDDSSAVVNSKLQVIGIQGLRVADACIMPLIVSAHPNIPIVAIAEKLSDMVKEEWGYK